jgi:CHAT domain-containing protein
VSAVAEGFAGALSGFVWAHSWAEARQILDEHPELLTDEADETLAGVAAVFVEKGEEHPAALIEHRRGLLRRCRAVGTDRAFAEWTRDRVAAVVDPDLGPLIGGAQLATARYERTRRRADLAEALRDWAAIVAHDRFGRLPAVLRLQVAAEAGMAYAWDYVETGDAASFDRGSALLTAALDGLAPDSPRRPSAAYHLGVLCYEGWRHTDRTELLDRAAELFAGTLDTAGPDDHLDLGARLGLARVGQARHAATGDPDWLRLAERSLGAATPPADARIATEVVRIRTQVLLSLHLDHDEPGALDTAVSVQEAAAAALADGTRERAADALVALGLVRHLRFRVSGDVADSDRAIEAARRGAHPDTLEMVLRERVAAGPADRTLLDELVDVSRRLVAGLPAGSPDRAARTGRLVAALALRYGSGHDPGELETALAVLAEVGDARGATDRVSGLLALAGALEDGQPRRVALVREAVGLAEPGTAGQARALTALGNLLTGQFDRDGDRILAAEAVDAQRRAATVAGPDANDRAACAVNLANTLLSTVVATGDRAALEEAATALAGHTDGSGPAGIEGVSTWGRLLLQRYLLDGRDPALDEAVTALTRAVESTNEPGPLVSRLVRLGNALHLRYYARGDRADLDRALATLDRFAQVARPAGAQRQAYLTELLGLTGTLRRQPDDPLLRARYHWLRYESVSLPVDREHDLRLALDHFLLAGLAPDGDRLAGMYDAAATVLGWAAASEGAAAADRAVDLLRGVLRLSEGRPEVHAAAVRGLRSALGNRYRRTGDLDSLTEAITLTRAATVATPPDPAGSADAQGWLGGLLVQRFERTGDPADLAESIRVGHESVAGTADDDPDLSLRLAALGNALKLRYRLGGDPADIAAAIAAGTRAIERAHDDDPNRFSHLTNLASFHQEHFERTADLASLDRAIELGRQARTQAPLDPVLLSNLSFALEARYEVTGDRAGLDESIEVARAAVAAAGVADPGRGRYLCSLSIALRMRYRLAGDPADLRGAIGAGRESVRCGGSDEYVATWRAMLALALRAEFLRSGDPAALAEAVHLAGECAAAEQSSGGGSVLARANYASVLMTRYGHTADPADLDRAIEVQRAAVPGPDGDRPQAGSLHLNLAMALRMRHDADPGGAGEGLLDEAEAHLRAAAGASDATTSTRVQAATEWGALAAERGRWGEATDGYRTAIELLPRLAHRALTRTGKEQQLVGISGVAGDAAAAALHAGRPALALELLEQGRGVLLAQELDTRDDRAQLRAAFPAYAEQLDELRAVLDPSGGPDDGTDADRRHRAARRWDEVLAEIRALPGFAEFQRPPSVARLAEAAVDAPVVAVNLSRYRSDALILRADGHIEVVPLPDARPETVAALVTDFLRAVSGNDVEAADRQLRTALAWLWDHVAGPVLDALGHPDSPTGPWPHVQWMPCGLLAFLPLHAAGSDGTGGVIDRVVSSYTTTIRALLRARSRRTSRDQLRRALIVAASAADLAMAPAEADLVHAALDADRPPLVGPQASAACVVATLPEVGWAHFACHGTGSFTGTGVGALVLGEERLPVTGITRLDISAHLAYLSACETAQGHGRLADEAIHLSAAFQLAGFRHVIGTLWRVADVVAYRFAAHAYERLSADPYRVAAATHAATRAVRIRYPTPLLWAAHVHIGPP